MTDARVGLTSPMPEPSGHRDNIRLLHRRGVPAYTHTPALAMPGEPEAITEGEQWLISQQASQRELRAWTTTRTRLLAELDHLRAHVHNPHVTRAARALEREIAALDDKLSS